MAELVVTLDDRPLHGSVRGPKTIGDFGVPELLEELQFQNFALPRAQGVESMLDALLHAFPCHGVRGLLLGRELRQPSRLMRMARASPNSPFRRHVRGHLVQIRLR